LSNSNDVRIYFRHTLSGKTRKICQEIWHT